ncbi:MAG: T9SS type A sorting domain-containing protein [bacterium]
MTFLLCYILMFQYWSTPMDLGIPGIVDINPQSCRRQGEHTCLVWEAYINGNWEIFSRFCYGASYTDTIRISNDVSDDHHPAIAYDQMRNCFWCVWERYLTDSSEIYISQGLPGSGWQPPQPVTTDSFYNSRPSVCVINGIIWVVWEKYGLIYDSVRIGNICAQYYDGNTWSPVMQLSNDMYLSNVNPKINNRYGHPFVVWQKGVYYFDIYYSEYINGNWQPQQDIAPHPAQDSRPEIAVEPSLLGDAGVWVAWMTDRISYNQFEIYCTAYDTFTTYYRITTHDSADVNPNPLQAIAITRQNLPGIAFATKRHGNYDIYTSEGNDTIFPVDTNTATDINPVMTGGDWYVWVLWQSDRDGDWDIYGSFIYCGGIEDTKTKNLKQQNQVLTVYPNPFTDALSIRFKGMRPEERIALQIYDITGKLIRQWNRQAIDKTDIVVWNVQNKSCHKIPAGIYFIKLDCDDESFIQSVVKIR